MDCVDTLRAEDEVITDKYGNFRDYLVLSYEIKKTFSLDLKISCYYSFSPKMVRLDIISSHFIFDKLRQKVAEALPSDTDER